MPESVTTSERDALAAKYFPESWEKAKASGFSKQRNRLRKSAEAIDKKKKLAADGAKCSSCQYFNSEGPCGSYCDLGTDFYGYSITKPDDLCHRWVKRP